LRGISASAGYTPGAPARTDDVIEPSDQAPPPRTAVIRVLAQGACAVLLIAGLIGITISRDIEYRAGLATALLNISAVLVAATVLLTLSCGVAWLVVGRARAREWTSAALVTTVCAVFALAGLGAGANVLRLEAALRLQVGADFVFIGGAMPRDLAAQLEGRVHPRSRPRNGSGVEGSTWP
jgi:hypothetical protein